MSGSSPHPLQHWVDAGVLDPAADDGDLVELLAYYDRIGLDARDFDGVAPDNLARTVIARMLRPGARFTAEEARDACGLDDEQFARVIAASGYAPGEAFTELDVAAFGTFVAGTEVFSADELLHFSRVMSSAMARVADAALSLFRIDVMPALEAGDASAVEWARTNHAAAELLDSVFIPLGAFFQHELSECVRRSDLGRDRRTDQASASTLRLAVGFVDVVGYTPLTEQLSADELGRFVRDFEERVTTVVSANHDGRIVKLIGDEVMFIAIDATDACAIALDILDAFAEAGTLPRGGVATGDVVARGGDYYGVVVNLASRIVPQAVPGEVLVDGETARTTTGFTLEPAGRRELKGFAEPVRLWSLSRQSVI